MNFSIAGWKVVLCLIMFIAIVSLPIWFGARVTGAAYPTLLRSMLSLVTGVFFSFLGLFFGFPASLIIAPLAFICSFKLILEMSFAGAIMLCIIAAFGGAVMFKFVVHRMEKSQEPETSLIAPHQAFVL